MATKNPDQAPALKFDYRSLINRELERRQSKNPLYSLRAFARDIGMSPSRLSESMNNVRGISLEVSRKICRELRLDAHDRQLFLLSVQVQHARSRSERLKADQKLLKLLAQPRSPPELVDTRTGWVEAALLKMHEYGRDLNSSDALAAALRVPAFMVVNSLRFLTRLGFVSGIPGYRTYLQDRGAGRRLNIDYQQVLDKAASAQGAEKRDSALFFMEPLMISAKHLPLVQKAAQRMFDDLKDLESSGDGTRVYFAALQVYPVEKPEDHRD